MWHGDSGGGDVGSGLRVSFTRVMRDMLALSRRTGVWPTPDVTRYIRSVITADGLISRFAPNLDVAQDLEKVCERYIRRESWKQWLSVENAADWTTAALGFMRDGPAALTAMLRQVTLW